METTYGLPRYRLPPTELVVQQIVAFCREALEEGATPVLLGYSLGKAQEILCSLAEAEPPADAARLGLSHDADLRAVRAGVSATTTAGTAKAFAGKVLICPPSVDRSQMIQRIKNKRVAMISGWAVEPNAIYRYQVDAAFPLSDHADYDDLAALRRAGATEARPHPARLRRGVRARPARARSRSLGAERSRTRWS